jgi:phosphotriesterase-related protein
MTYMHEHLRIDLSKEKNDPDCLLDEFDKIRDELRALAARGVTRFVDMSCRGMGRDYAYLDRMERETGIAGTVSTGCYKTPFHPPVVGASNAARLAKLLVADIEEGAEGSPRKAVIIGEVGSSLNKMTENEEKVFIAASLAHAKTGVPISTHTTLGTMGREQIALFKAHGVDPKRLIIGHLDLANSLEVILAALDEGVYVEFDTVGKLAYLPDEQRAAFIKACVDRGYGRQLLLSMDITRRSHLQANGGIGYAYLLDSFLPRLRAAGVGDGAITAMLADNPAEVLP